MKKILISLFLVIGMISPSFAQPRGVTRLMQWLRGGRVAGQSVSRLPATVKEGESLSHLSAAVSNQVQLASRSTVSPEVPVRNFIPVHPDLWTPLPPELDGYTRSVFRARSFGINGGSTLSGFVFKTTYQGEEELFGVIAAHSLASRSNSELLGEEFIAEVFDENGLIAVRGKLVQITPTKTMDLALVKFHPRDEKLFTPLTIASQPVSQRDKLLGVGFGQGKWTVTRRSLLQDTPFSLRTTFPLKRDARPGLCGSPVLNEKYELVGVHTGSTREAKLLEDVGFATKADFLPKLVEAYHNNGKATFPLYLDGKQIASLGIDEFVSFVRLQNDRGRIIWRHEVRSKFPYNDIMERLPHARYIELSINRAIWTGSYLQQDILFPRTVKYDLLEQHPVK